jgi:peroxiredoxin
MSRALPVQWNARQEHDARRSAQLYQQYMDRFDDNVSWSELAARDRFLLIEQHRDQFTLQDLIEAAAKWESRERAFSHEFGNSARYSMMANEVAKALLDADPATSLDYSRKGAGDLAEHWVDSDGADFLAQEMFWPLMLEAQIKLQKWVEAERLSKATVHEIEAGHLFPELTKRAEETRVRRLYAEALDHGGKTEEARFELSVAVALSPEAKQPFEDYLRRHPLSDGDRSKLEAEAKSIARNADDRRTMRAKADLLALEHKQLATPFRLKNLEGKEVALADFSSKALVVAFWATWCGPCVEELRELNRFSSAFTDNPRAALLTISIDDTLSVVLEFARKSGYHFPILKSHGQVEHAYTEQKTLDGTQIPQLYVFDPEGNIRFHIVGFDDDGLFEKKIDWMLEAVQR